jgi:hypothetical protein
LDLAGINSWILYKETTGEKISRKKFLFGLAEELASDYVELKRKTKSEDSFCADTSVSTNNSVNVDRKRCSIVFCNRNKATTICNKCKKCVCGGCTSRKLYMCKNCD